MVLKLLENGSEVLLLPDVESMNLVRELPELLLFWHIGDSQVNDSGLLNTNWAFCTRLEGEYLDHVVIRATDDARLSRVLKKLDVLDSS